MPERTDDPTHAIYHFVGCESDVEHQREAVRILATTTDDDLMTALVRTRLTYILPRDEALATHQRIANDQRLAQSTRASAREHAPGD